MPTQYRAFRSINPLDDPVIENNYLSAPEEIREFILNFKSVKSALAIGTLEYIGEERLPGPNLRSDAHLEQYVRAAASSCLHSCGTCRMGDADSAPTPEAARQLVADAELRVCGIYGLGVVDASVMPSITSRNLNANVMMIAERAADFMTASYF